jgi:TRAP-type mannitol/chloroaromatic compound transport system permease small subunit
VDIAGNVLLLLPMMAFLIIASWDYVSVSWSIREGSREAGGLPFPFVPLLKTLIPLTAGLVMLQGIGNLVADVCRLREVADDSDEASEESGQPGA